MNRPIDALYSGFVNALPEGLRPLAADLPHRLGLAPAAGIPWSQVFSHEVTLEAPALIAEAFPEAPPELIRLAVLGHSLSVIEAFLTDRVSDGQVAGSAELYALSEHLRTSRDSVLELISVGTAWMAREADRTTQEGIAAERALLSQLAAVTFEEYQRISLAKQAIGFPASIALARASGATPTQIEEIKRALSGVWLGLQFEDDASDWEDDWRRGQGAWAVSLARRRLEAVREESSDERPTEPDLIRRRVFSMRVLYLMMRRARFQYRSAGRYARVIGLTRLQTWTAARVAHLDDILPLEDRHPGYVVRSRKLAAWAAEVLS